MAHLPLQALLTPTAMIFAAATAAILALVLILFVRTRVRNGRMLSLQDAAASAYESAKRKRMVIATVADRAGATQDAIAWFVQSIASVIPIYRRRNGSFKKVDPSSAHVASGPLHIFKRDLAAYLRWARSVQ
jgi:hypothetical protein